MAEGLVWKKCKNFIAEQLRWWDTKQINPIKFNKKLQYIKQQINKPNLGQKFMGG